MRNDRALLAAALSSAVILAAPASALAKTSSDAATGGDVVIGGGVCEDKDVKIVVTDPISGEKYRVCFDYPPKFTDG